MVKRPTIPDLAEAAEVSISTVNRVISAPWKVRQQTRERVLGAAREIGFYGIGSIEYSVNHASEVHRLGVLLQQGDRPFYRILGESIRRVAEAYQGGSVKLTLEFLDDLSPANVAERLKRIGASCESVALVGAEHPVVSEAIDGLLEQGVPVTGLITPLSARGSVGFVGLDYWKVGRTAAWAFDRMVKAPGKIGLLIGNPRYRNQELNESGFRSYFREHNAGFTILEPQSTNESATHARGLVEAMLREHPDLCGLFVSGGGISGAVAALRECPHREDFVAVGYELFDTTRLALIDGTLTMVISHPMAAFAAEAISVMVRAKKAGPEAGALSVTLGFEIYTSENV
jgi:LacI family transcriptional regulator